MNDFEVHPRGTTDTLVTYLEEIRLSRELAREIEQTIDQWGLVIPQNVVAAHSRLLRHYQEQIEKGVQ